MCGPKSDAGYYRFILIEVYPWRVERDFVFLPDSWMIRLTCCMYQLAHDENLNKQGAPCGFSGRFEDGSFSMKMKMKIFSNLHWRISGFLKSEDYQLPQLLKMRIAFLKLLKTEDLKTPYKNVKKMNTMSCAGSPKQKTFFLSKC